ARAGGGRCAGRTVLFGRGAVVGLASIGIFSRLLLVPQRFGDGSVMPCGLEAGLQLERLVVGLDRFVEPFTEDQGIAAVIVVGGAVTAGELFGCAGMVTGLKPGKTLPSGILETLGSLCGALSFQQALALLIG